MKSNYTEIIVRLESKLSGIREDNGNIDKLLELGMDNLLKLHECYDNGVWVGSRDLIGSIYPENFTISENKFRTPRVNEVVCFIYLINNEMSVNKSGTNKKISHLSRQVAKTGVEPVTSGL
ncbi:hypothetical protein D3C80_1775980 [compost metagenome]